jgi:lysophospholipase L1-like esterase
MTTNTAKPNAGPVSRPSGFARLPRWKRALFLSVPFIVLFLAGEIAGRLLERYAGYLPRRRASYIASNPYIRSALVPGFRFRSALFEVDVNSLGFRGDEFAVPKPSGTFRIFAIGESTTFGWKGVHSHREAWPALLEAKLRAAYPGRAIEVINAGVPSITSVEQRINLMLRISKLQPDAILIYHGNNDINWSWVPDLETKLIYGRKFEALQITWWDRLVEHSYVYMELRSRMDMFRRSSALKHDEPDPTALRMLSDNLRDLIGDAQRMRLKIAIGTFAHALDESGSPGVFSDAERKLGVPVVGRYFENLSPQGVRRTFPLYNAHVRELAANTRVPLCDLAPAIPKTTEYFIDWCHFSRKGEETVAAHWFDTIKKAGWFE